MSQPHPKPQPHPSSPSSSSSSSSVSRFLSRYYGIEGGVLLKSGWARSLGARSPAFSKMNNALWAAPVFKWGLAIVPLYAAVTGNPPVEKLDINTSAALTFTGVVWAYYSTLVRPRATELFAVSVALVGANGWNLYRRYQFNQTMEKEKATALLQSQSASASASASGQSQSQSEH